jgi:hypothetical protein
MLMFSEPYIHHVFLGLAKSWAYPFIFVLDRHCSRIPYSYEILQEDELANIVIDNVTAGAPRLSTNSG